MFSFLLCHFSCVGATSAAMSCFVSMIPELVLLQGSAKRPIKAVLQEAARKREMRHSDLKRIDRKVHLHFHDDINCCFAIPESRYHVTMSTAIVPAIDSKCFGALTRHEELVSSNKNDDSW